ncbi:sulfotransferase domain-containing protein [Phormidium tenue FACHB-886]|nr:sulfotransferase domain-containing protein [Phormidium tenue FACHB-886]
MQDSTEIEILSDDIFLVSYPRSGSTWLRFLIASYLADQQTDFFKFMRIVPEFTTAHSRSINSKIPESLKVIFLITRTIGELSIWSEMDGRSGG